MTSCSGPAQVTEILRHEHFLAQLHRARFEKLLQRCPYLAAAFCCKQTGDVIFSGQNCRVLLVGQHDSVWNSVCFPPWCHENASMFFKKLTARKQVSATKMLEIRAETATRNGSLAKDFPFHLFFVNVPRLKKVGERVVKPGWLETWWDAT